MDLTRSILQDVREAVGLTPVATDFDIELIMHINTALGVLDQNGVIKPTVLQDENTTWGDLQDQSKTEGNRMFHLVQSYVVLSTKLIFDPPPPSAVEYQTRNVDQILWRLMIAYDTSYSESVK